MIEFETTEERLTFLFIPHRHHSFPKNNLLNPKKFLIFATVNLINTM